METPHDPFATWDRWSSWATWRRTLADAERSGKDHLAATARDRLAKLEAEPVTALEALRANAELVAGLTGRRWQAMKDAREQGATWEQVGEALGTTKQGAQVAYRRAIEAQEKYAGDFHKGEAAAAARAVL